ncbi:MAG: Stp1/IreP family PP2C-type Ser/Thr phosphatase [Acidimicrobiia bacterium]|nr:Stp1/IreP family PP2C-type Ser/Thr phosphatase [Acidimicrobiia bacterium]
MKFVWASGTHVGRIRNQNEDSLFPETSGAGPGPLLVAVADGMGGHVGGEVASQVAIETATADSPESPHSRIASANAAVLARAQEEPELRGMGTTLTLAILTDSGAEVGHVGDSRGYLFREGALTRITDDHSYVEFLRREGRLSDEDIAHHPMRHVVMRALGLEEEVDIDTYHQDLQPGDRILLCSDGLTGMVPDAGISEILGAEPAAEAVVWSLIEAANSAGGTDNTTVVLVDVEA